MPRPIKTEFPDDAMLVKVAEQFRALAEPARLKILARLLEADATVGELADAFGWSQANASKHVTVLAAVGFVRRTRQGATVVCSVADAVVKRLCDLMCSRVADRATAEAAQLLHRNGNVRRRARSAR